LQYTNSYVGKKGSAFGPQYQIMDAKEKRRKRDRERYARMTNEEKQKKRREAYHQKKTKEPNQRTKGCTEEEKEEMLEKTP
jgi:imidazolonepropionase-like amidohydrolase